MVDVIDWRRVSKKLSYFPGEGSDLSFILKSITTKEGRRALLKKWRQEDRRISVVVYSLIDRKHPTVKQACKDLAKGDQDLEYLYWLPSINHMLDVDLEAYLGEDDRLYLTRKGERQFRLALKEGNLAKG